MFQPQRGDNEWSHHINLYNAPDRYAGRPPSCLVANTTLHASTFFFRLIDLWPCVFKVLCTVSPPHTKEFHSESASQFSHSVMSDSLWPHGLQHARLPCPSLTPRAYSNSCPSSQWCHPTISSSVVPFSHLQFFPTSGSFPRGQSFTSGGQSLGVSASSSVLPMNIQDWLPLGLTGWISLQSKGLLRIFSNTTDQKHQFFSAQLYLWSNSHIHTRLGKTIALTGQTFVGKVMSPAEAVSTSPTHISAVIESDSIRKWGGSQALRESYLISVSRIALGSFYILIIRHLQSSYHTLLLASTKSYILKKLIVVFIYVIRSLLILWTFFSFPKSITNFHK